MHASPSAKTKFPLNLHELFYTPKWVFVRHTHNCMFGWEIKNSGLRKLPSNYSLGIPINILYRHQQNVLPLSSATEKSFRRNIFFIVITVKIDQIVWILAENGVILIVSCAEDE